MCAPGAIQAASSAINAAANITRTTIEINQQTKNNEYRAQIVANNIKNAQNEALRQTQLGIDKSREEKLSGIRKANELLAQNASSASDTYSGSAFLNYGDIQNESFNNAKEIQDSYNYKADKYYEKANNYAYNFAISQKNYKNSLYKTALNSLSSFSRVASSWYQNEE